MKKIVAILLLITYSFSALGISLKGHTCCNKLQPIAVAFCKHESNKSGKSQAQNDCCKFKVAYTKISDSYLASNLPSSVEKCSTSLYTLSASLQVFHYNLFHKIVISGSPPVLPSRVSIYIFDCVYRI